MRRAINSFPRAAAMPADVLAELGKTLQVYEYELAHMCDWMWFVWSRQRVQWPLVLLIVHDAPALILCALAPLTDFKSGRVPGPIQRHAAASSSTRAHTRNHFASLVCVDCCLDSAFTSCPLRLAWPRHGSCVRVFTWTRLSIPGFLPDAAMGRKINSRSCHLR